MTMTDKQRDEFLAWAQTITQAVIGADPGCEQPVMHRFRQMFRAFNETEQGAKSAFTGIYVAGEPVTVDELKLFRGRTLDEACTEIIAQRAAKRDARDAREGGQTFPRTGAGGQA